jgi:hypothetical protein
MNSSILSTSALRDTYTVWPRRRPMKAQQFTAVAEDVEDVLRTVAERVARMTPPAPSVDEAAAVRMHEAAEEQLRVQGDEL